MSAPKRICSIDGCEGAHEGHGWCSKHYQRWKKHGDPLRGFRTIEERFWAKVDVQGSDECWPWNARRTRWGYGQFGAGGRHGGWLCAHRVAWTLTHGPIAYGLWVLHTCDNPPCCNPRHLFLGTHADNMADMAAKGRRVIKLTDADVEEIRAATGISQRKLASRYGVAPSYISMLRSGVSRTGVQSRA